MQISLFCETFKRIFPFIISICVPVILAWVVSQILKTVLKIILGTPFSIKMLFNDGDFPSTHTCVSVTFTICIWNQLFIKIATHPTQDPTDEICLGCIATIWSLFIIRDALGIRYTVEKLGKTVHDGYLASAKLSNTLQETFESLAEKAKFKSGHMPHEVIGGIILGCIVGLSFTFYSFNSYCFIALLIFTSIYFVIIIAIFLLARKRKK